MRIQLRYPDGGITETEDLVNAIGLLLTNQVDKISFGHGEHGRFILRAGEQPVKSKQMGFVQITGVWEYWFEN